MTFSRVFLCQRCFVASEEAAVAYIDEMVDGDGSLEYVDKVGSVRALAEAEDGYVPDHNELFLDSFEGDPHGS